MEKHTMIFRAKNPITGNEQYAVYSIEFDENQNGYVIHRKLVRELVPDEYHYCGCFPDLTKAFKQTWKLTCEAFGKENIVDWDCE